jgi:surface protein
MPRLVIRDNEQLRAKIYKYFGNSEFRSKYPIGTWNTSAVTDMSRLFENYSGFNEDISRWNTSNVTNMDYMFARTFFNKPINTSADGRCWNVSNVTSMKGMFHYTPFNQDISNWNTSSVTNMEEMFHTAYMFNKPINTSLDGNCWNTSNVISMRKMFQNTTSFNHYSPGNFVAWRTSINLLPRVVIN